MITPERLGDTERKMRETEDCGGVKASFHSLLSYKPGRAAGDEVFEVD